MATPARGPVADRRLVATALVLLGYVAGSVAVAGGAGPPKVPRLDHVVLIVFENHERDSVIGSPAAPTFNRLARTYAQASNYFAVAHPSLPNYLALVSGSTHGVTDDCTECNQSGPTIGTQLTNAGRSWAAYVEGYPGSPRYAKKHVPFLYFPGGSSHVFDLGRFDRTHLPAFSLVVPDLCHDMHDCSVSTGDAWLATFVGPLLHVGRTAVFIVFDEGTSSQGGGGRVPLIVAGTAVKRHGVDSARASHYSLLRTMEEALGVRPLGGAARARDLIGIWRQG